MVEKAQVLLAGGFAIAIIVMAVKGNLALVVDRSETRGKARAVARPILRERWLVLVVGGSVLPGLFNLLGIMG